MRYIEAIRSQGENLRSSYAAVSAATAGLDLEPWRRGRCAVAGMGASFNAALAAVPLQQRDFIDTIAMLASDLFDPALWATVSSTIAVSQSGRSRETIACTQGRSEPCLAITDDPESPLARHASVHVPLGLLEDSPVRTLGYTATLQALNLVGNLLASQRRTDWLSISRAADKEVPAAEEFAEKVAAAVSSCSSVDLVAGRLAFGTVAQGALLFREACRMPSCYYSTYQYLHGPLEPAENNSVVILCGAEREVQLARYLREAGATVVLITTADVDEGGKLFVHRIPDLGEDAGPVLEIISLQCITWLVAQARGLTVESLRHSQPDTKMLSAPDED